MDGDCKFCSTVRTWLKKPFDQDGSVIEWFLFVGLIAIISFLWTRILERILR